jgi:hypothetical protein
LSTFAVFDVVQTCPQNEAGSALMLKFLYKMIVIVNAGSAVDNVVNHLKNQVFTLTIRNWTTAVPAQG